MDRPAPSDGAAGARETRCVRRASSQESRSRARPRRRPPSRPRCRGRRARAGPRGEGGGPTTSGQLANPPLAMSFVTSPLATTATGGFISTTELFCSSQAQVDALCPIVPFLCGQTCVLVPGAPYDPATGKLHLVGPEQVQGCDGGVCSGPFVNFARTGDLQLTETPIPGVPAASESGRLALALLLAASATAALRRRQGTRIRRARSSTAIGTRRVERESPIA